jgi:hypothetical protein
MNIFKTILNFVPSILTIPFYIGSFLYLILLPDITYYALGIYLDIWIPALRTFWGFPILFILLMIPFVSTILVWLLTFQSFWVLFKFLIGSYYPRDELLGFVTMYPAAVVIISYTVSYILLRRENSSSTNSPDWGTTFPRNQDTPASNTREEDSATDRASSSSEAKTRGESSTAARAARAASSSEANSSEAKTRGETSKAARAARAASSSEVSKRRRSSTASRAAEASSKNPKNSTKETSSEVDDIFFDNRRKK